MNPSHTTDPGGTTALRSVSDEELYAAHLEGRLRQALERLNAARTALQAQPGDFRCAAEVMQRVHVLRDLRSRCEVQRARVSAARAAAGLEPFPDAAAVAAPVRQDPFRKTQTRRARHLMAALEVRPRTCPACQAPLAPPATRCHCGCLLEPRGREPRGDTARGGA